MGPVYYVYTQSYYYYSFGRFFLHSLRLLDLFGVYLQICIFYLQEYSLQVLLKMQTVH